MNQTEARQTPGLYRPRDTDPHYLYTPSPGVMFILSRSGSYTSVALTEQQVGGNNRWTGVDLVPITEKYTVNFDGATFTGVTLEPPAPPTFRFDQLRDNGIYSSDESVYTPGPVFYVILSNKNRFAVGRNGAVLQDNDVNGAARRFTRIADVTDLQSLLALIGGVK